MGGCGTRVPDGAVAHHAGTVLLAAAFLVHYANALWSIYQRRSLRMPRWELWQLLLGLAIPFLLTLHVMGTRVAELAEEVSTSYASILLLFWHSAPWIGVMQTVALLVVWAHGCIGVHFWLRTKAWYREWVVAFRAFAILLPTLALAGFVAGGNQTLREAVDPDYVRTTRDNTYATRGGGGAGLRRRQDRDARSTSAWSGWRSARARCAVGSTAAASRRSSPMPTDGA